MKTPRTLRSWGFHVLARDAVRWPDRWTAATEAAMASLAAGVDGRLHLSFRFGDYLIEGAPLAVLEAEEAPDVTWEEALQECLVRLDGESVSEHYVHGMTPLMEVAIKALSPGINDPGIA